MKILVYGAGVIGSIFAAKLALSGHEVSVLARNNRYAQIKKSGIVLRNPSTMREEIADVKAVETLEKDDVYDYIIVAMQRTQVGGVLDTLAKNASGNIVFVVNTASGYAEWIKAIGAQRLMVGFPSAGGERTDKTVDYFVGKGAMRVFQTTTFGEINGEKLDRVKTLIKMFDKAGIPSAYCKNMEVWQKTHVAMVTCIANALYKYNCSNYELAKSKKDLKIMCGGIKEGFAVLRASGLKPTPKKLWYFNLPACVTATVFQAVMKTKLAEITMAKHCVAAKAEMMFLQSEFDKIIAASGVKTPNIDILRSYLLAD